MKPFYFSPIWYTTGGHKSLHAIHFLLPLSTPVYRAQVPIYMRFLADKMELYKSCLSLTFDVEYCLQSPCSWLSKRPKHCLREISQLHVRPDSARCQASPLPRESRQAFARTSDAFAIRSTLVLILFCHQRIVLKRGALTHPYFLPLSEYTTVSYLS